MKTSCINLIFIFSISLVGCGTLIGDLLVGSAAGAFGNMIDRRIEDQLGNSVEKFNEMFEPELKMEKYYERKNCENDKWGRADWRL